MKSCPTCNRTYSDDALAFCLMDGSVLSAPYDPGGTQRIPEPRTTGPAATEMLSPTLAAVESRPPLKSTIHAPAPELPPQYSPPPADDAGAKKSSLPLILIAIGVLLVGAVGIVVLASRLLRETPPNAKPSTRDDKAEKINQSKSACGFTVDTALYDKWIQMGGESGKLGCPIGSDDGAPTSPQGTRGRWIQFAHEDGGYLIKHESGAHASQVFEVSGCMYKLYSSQAGTKSSLGFPVSDGYTTAPGARQEFEGGYIVWDSKTYQCRVHKQ